MNDIEIWKDIKGYEGMYQVSNLGNIKSLERYKRNHSKLQKIEEKLLKLHINKTNGYVYVVLTKDTIEKNIRVHKLVAQAFIENSNNKPQINHIDGNKQNNRVDNLEWCTQSENELHAYRTGLANNDKRKIKIRQYSMDGKLLKTFNSLSEASKLTGVNIQKISLCINNKYKYRNKKEKYIWKKVVE